MNKIFFLEKWLNFVQEESAKKLGLCYNCLMYGHLARLCPKPRAQVSAVLACGECMSKNDLGC